MCKPYGMIWYVNSKKEPKVYNTRQKQALRNLPTDSAVKQRPFKTARERTLHLQTLWYGMVYKFVAICMCLCGFETQERGHSIHKPYGMVWYVNVSLYVCVCVVLKRKREVWYGM